MKAVILLILALWIAGGAGRFLLSRLTIFEGRTAEKFVYSTALGLAVAAYGVYFLGLLGFLAFWPITLWWLVLALVGWRGMMAQFKELLPAIKNIIKSEQESTVERGVHYVALFVLVVCGIIGLLTCFQPLTGLHWDAVAYHLADPKIFLQQGHITSLPTEHHSNFPFTMEMLFTVGLLYDAYPLANLFHLLTGALTVVVLVAYGQRVYGQGSGWIAGLLFATTPVVLWEAGVAYIDLGLGLYVLLAFLAAIEATETTSEQRHFWLILSGGMMGFALGIKYLALIPFGLLGLYLLLQRVPVRHVALCIGIAVLVGSPWYIKNSVLMHNPVYPYLYNRFPNSRYWSADRARTYESEQKSFGFVHTLNTPDETLQNLIQTPWRLLVSANRYSNGGEYTFMALFGGLYAALVFALVFVGPLPRSLRDLLLFGLTQLLLWFFIAQISRYIVSMLPVFALCAGYAASRLLSGKSPVTVADRAVQIAVGILLVGQSLLLLGSVFWIPSNARQAFAMGTLPTAVSLPELFQQWAEKSESKKGLDVATAMEWINANSPSDKGVILYEDTRGFLLDRYYLWGNGEHSSYIPYETIQNGADLTNWLREKKIGYALVNLNWSRRRASDETFATGVNGREEEALQKWYADSTIAVEKWRQVVNDAIRTRIWRPVFAARGVIVLTVGEDK